MSGAAPQPSWNEAARAAAILAVDPLGTGVALRASAGPTRDAWLALVRRLLPEGAPMRRLPLHVGDGRLLGGLDLAATLRAGRPIAERGILADADGGLVLVAMAERLAPTAAAKLVGVLDAGAVTVERDGLALAHPARFAVIALDEGVADDEIVPVALADRLAIHLDLAGLDPRLAAEVDIDREAVIAARALLPQAVAADEVITALCTAAAELGIAGVRAPLLAVRTARAAAALAGRRAVLAADASLAVRLVLVPRAGPLPAAAPAEESEPPPDPPAEPEDSQRTSGEPPPPEELVLAAVRAAIPADLLARLRATGEARSRIRSSGRSGAVQKAGQRGRPAGTRRGEPGAGARLHLTETLRAAAPWQSLRRRDDAPARIEIRRDDFRIVKLRHRARTTTIFAVDASGSAAMHRLAEAKGAVELLLAECYVRRDQVALVAFRGSKAELLLPPTRSLARAKRSLAGLPGGGGTPLAAGIDAAVAVAEAARRRGDTPALVILTDGRANVGRDGIGGRARAEAEALAAARPLRAAGISTILVDTAPHPQPLARRLAEEMRATYLPLPHADAASLSRAVRAAPPPRTSP